MKDTWFEMSAIKTDSKSRLVEGDLSIVMSNAIRREELNALVDDRRAQIKIAEDPEHIRKSYPPFPLSTSTHLRQMPLGSVTV